MTEKKHQAHHGRSSPEVIVFCMKKRFSGVTATIDNLLPSLAKLSSIAYVGPVLPHALKQENQMSSAYSSISFWEAIKISFRRLPDGRKRIWHLRRNKEMLLGWICRDILRLPIHLVFTSAAIRKHSAFPRWLIRRMDAVIATSDEAADVVSNATSIVPHGIDIRRFSLPAEQSLGEGAISPSAIEQLLENKRQAWQALGLSGTYGVGIFGRVRKEKGIHLFVEAMLSILPLYPEFTAFIAGLCQPDDQAYQQDLIHQIEQAGLSERIVFVGDIPSKDIPQWYQASLIAVACPLYEGFGLTIVESMACGCAAVASRTGAFASMIADNETGKMIALNDSQALKQGLEPMLNDVQQTAMMGLKGRQRVETLFPLEKEAEGILKQYHYLWTPPVDSMEL